MPNTNNNVNIVLSAKDKNLAKTLHKVSAAFEESGKSGVEAYKQAGVSANEFRKLVNVANREVRKATAGTDHHKRAVEFLAKAQSEYKNILKGTSNEEIRRAQIQEQWDQRRWRNFIARRKDEAKAAQDSMRAQLEAQRKVVKAAHDAENKRRQSQLSQFRTTTAFSGVPQLGAAGGLLSTNTLATINGVALAVTGVAIAFRGMQSAISLVNENFGLFEQRILRVQAVTGATSGETSILEKQVRNLGRTTIFTAKQVAEGAAELGMAGNDMAEISTALPEVLKLATAGGIEFGQAADYATNIIKAYGKEMSDLSRVNDILAQSGAKSNQTVIQAAEAIQKSAGIARVAKIDMEELSTAIAILADRGIRGSQAGTFLNSVLTSLSTKADNVTEDMAALGVEFDNSTLQAEGLEETLRRLEGVDPEILKKIVGQRQMSRFLTLINGATDGWQEMYTTMLDSRGAAQAMVDVIESGFTANLAKMNSAFEELKLTLTDTDGIFGSFVNNAVAGITTLLNKVNSLNDTPLDKIEDSFADLIKSIDNYSAGDPLTGIVSDIQREAFEELAIPRLAQLQNELDETTKKLKSYEQAVERKNEALESGLYNEQEYKRDLDRLNPRIAEQTKRFNELTGEIDRINEMMRQLSGDNNPVNVITGGKGGKAKLTEAQLEIINLRKEYEKYLNVIKTNQASSDAFPLSSGGSVSFGGEELLNPDFLPQEAIESAPNIDQTVIDSVRELNHELSLLNNTAKLFGTDGTELMRQQMDAIGNQMQEMVNNGVPLTNEALISLANQYNNLGMVLTEIESKQQRMNELFQIGTGLLSSMANQAIKGSLTIQKAMQMALQAVVQYTIKLLAAQAAQAFSSVIASAFKVGGVIGGVPLAAAGTAAVSGALATIPEFANGGIVSGDTIARVGEYNNANTNPEVIAPLNKLEGIMLKSLSRMGMMGSTRGSQMMASGDQLISVQRDYMMKNDI